jgi:hypothetical protein
MKRLEMKKAFVRAVAEYLAGGSAMKSIELEMGKPHALEWAKVRQAANLMGWVTVEEAERHLTELLG